MSDAVFSGVVLRPGHAKFPVAYLESTVLIDIFSHRIENKRNNFARRRPENLQSK
jgi:hypothetical protein